MVRCEELLLSHTRRGSTRKAVALSRRETRAPPFVVSGNALSETLAHRGLKGALGGLGAAQGPQSGRPVASREGRGPVT